MPSQCCWPERELPKIVNMGGPCVGMTLLTPVEAVTSAESSVQTRGKSLLATMGRVQQSCLSPHDRGDAVLAIERRCLWDLMRGSGGGQGGEARRPGYFPGVYDLSTWICSFLPKMATVLTRPTPGAYQRVADIRRASVFSSMRIALNLPAGTSTSSSSLPTV